MAIYKAVHIVALASGVGLASYGFTDIMSLDVHPAKPENVARVDSLRNDLDIDSLRARQLLDSGDIQGYSALYSEYKSLADSPEIQKQRELFEQSKEKTMARCGLDFSVCIGGVLLTGLAACNLLAEKYKMKRQSEKPVAMGSV